MSDTAEELLSRLLDATIEDLDIPAHLHQAADEQYRAVAHFLADQSEEGPTEWEVYPQGSFRLGTVVRPLGADHYDLDMVCRLNIATASTTQAKLKARVGDALDSYLKATIGESGGPTACEDRRRVWTLEYPHAFHVDVLPAVPNENDQPYGICLTDKQIFEWQESNPVAYSDWFRGRMAAELLRKQAAIATRAIEPIPESQIRTTLQRVTQVLKRHRDLYFEEPEDRPASILVTTLAAHAYRDEQDLFSAVMEAAATMPGYVECTDGVWRVMSPVADENFADKWNEDPARADRFFGWLKQLATDLDEARRTSGLRAVEARLAKSFGPEPVEKAFGRLGDNYRTTREQGLLKATATGVLSTTTGTTIPRHGFFGTPEK